MEAGDFELTGETIILSDKWKLMNGQHRLNACIVSKQPFDAVIIQGVPERVFLKLDSGKSRKAADWLSSGNYQESNAKVLAGALGLIWHHFNGGLDSAKQTPTNDEIAKTLDDNPGIRQFNTSTFAKSVHGMPGSLVLALRYIFGTYDSKVAADFFEKLATGEGLKRGNPSLLLRDRLSQKEKGRSRTEVAALTIKAWNAWLEGREITPYHLRFRKGSSAEPFPKIAGVEHQLEAGSINPVIGGC